MKKMSLLAVLLLGTSVSFADPVPPSDEFNVFDPAGQNILQIMLFKDAGFIVRNGVVAPAPPEGSPIFAGIAGDPSRVDSPTVFLSNGSISDIFGVFFNPASGRLEVGFVSDGEGTPLPSGAVFLPEPTTPLEVTQYLDPSLQVQGYRASFFSVSVPDVGCTGCLLGLACVGLSLIGRKRKSQFVRNPGIGREESGSARSPPVSAVLRAGI